MKNNNILDTESTKRKKIKKSIKLIIVFIAIIIFAYIAEDVMEKEILSIDNSIYSYLIRNRNEALNTFFIILTEFGGVFAIVILTALLLIFLKKEHKIMVLANVIIITILNQVLKIIFARPRPEIMRLIEENGYSFPSGHSMVSTAFYGLLIYLIYKNVKNKYVKWIGIIFLILLILGICISRIYLGVHYASDVIGGFCFSIAYIIVFINIIKKEVGPE